MFGLFAKGTEWRGWQWLALAITFCRCREIICIDMSLLWILRCTGRAGDPSVIHQNGSSSIAQPENYQQTLWEFIIINYGFVLYPLMKHDWLIQPLYTAVVPVPLHLPEPLRNHEASSTTGYPQGLTPAGTHWAQKKHENPLPSYHREAPVVVTVASEAPVGVLDPQPAMNGWTQAIYARFWSTTRMANLLWSTTKQPRNWLISWELKKNTGPLGLLIRLSTIHLHEINYKATII